MKIEIVVHCYSETHPVYAAMLTAQLSSLALWPPNAGFADVKVTICTSGTDRRTADVARSFAAIFPANISVSLRAMDLSRLLRRSIGRNACAKASKADIVWFADADYWFGQGCLDRLANSEIGIQLAYPQVINWHRDLPTGDVEIAKIMLGQMFRPSPELYSPCKMRKAIGGCQIISGDVARQKGYCDGTKWQKPVKEPRRFKNTGEDVAFRKLFASQLPLDLPNVYRIRHTESALQSPEQRGNRNLKKG